MNEKERQREAWNKTSRCSRIRKESFCHCSWRTDLTGIEIGLLSLRPLIGCARQERTHTTYPDHHRGGKLPQQQWRVREESIQSAH